jgi:hypothetical protein
LRKLYLSDAADGAVDDMVLFPSHNYAALKHATMGEQKKTNPYLKLSSLKQFLAAMGYH